MDRRQSIQNNLTDLKREIPASVELIAVSKNYPFSDIVSAYDGGRGISAFGESRVQELLSKAQAAREQKMQLEWHFIGRIQTNKLQKLLLVPGLSAIHSLSNLRQVKEIEKCVAAGKLVLSEKIQLFLQIKTVGSNEDKDGFTDEREIQTALARLALLSSHFKVVGLMTMGEMTTADFATAARRCFNALSELRNRWGYPQWKLSMGMSRDYSIAIECGANYVRLGRKIFG